MITANVNVQYCAYEYELPQGRNPGRVGAQAPLPLQPRQHTGFNGHLAR